MSELEFIELVIRYQDGQLNQAEVDQLSTAMLHHPKHRALYRDLFHQAQLSHEWQSTNSAPVAVKKNITKIIAFGAAAAALALLTSVAWLRSFPHSDSLSSATTPHSAPALNSSWFPAIAPAWSELFPSPFDYPDFVWQAEISSDATDLDSIDEFSNTDILPLLATSPAAEFNRLLAPIVLLPSAELPYQRIR